MGTKPVAYGYISVEGDDEAEIEKYHEAVVLHSLAEDLGLEEIYVDRNIPAAQVSGRPALSTVLALVNEGEGVYVIVPSLDAMSKASGVRRAMALEIAQAGGHLEIVTGEASDNLPLRKPGTSYAVPVLRDGAG
jgi:DNA invertase Pin-like site-specific DNA recombinase